VSKADRMQMGQLCAQGRRADVPSSQMRIVWHARLVGGHVHGSIFATQMVVSGVVLGGYLLLTGDPQPKPAPALRV
jgi:hypothetical protein